MDLFACLPYFRFYATRNISPEFILNTEVEKIFSVYLSRKISDLRYKKSEISHNLKE